MKTKLLSLALLLSLASIAQALTIDIIRNNNEATKRTIDMTESKTATVSYEDGITLILELVESEQGAKVNASFEKEGLDHKDVEVIPTKDGATIKCEGSDQTFKFIKR